jgi:hypothetical protein
MMQRAAWQLVALGLVLGMNPMLERSRADFVYTQTFDGLALGPTQPFPGDPGQGGFYSALALGGAFGEIQDAIANPGRALHEFAPGTNPDGLQTIDRLNFSTVNVSTARQISLSFDFNAHTSNLDAVNNYLANIEATGGPFPGFQIIVVGLGAGNGTPKSVTGVNVSLPAFNGTDNNSPIPLGVGQGLAFDAWHSVSVSLDQVADRYTSITVDGMTQDLSAFRPPRSFLGNQALRGQLIQTLETNIIPDHVGGDSTDDDVYWDNIRLSAVPTSVPEPASIALLGLGMTLLVGYARRDRRAG